MTESHWNALVQSIYTDRRWLLALDVLAGGTGLAKTLGELGASGVFAIGAGRGMGDLPPEPRVHLDNRGADLMSSIRGALELLADLPAEVVDQVDAWDPDREARVIGTIFDDGRPVAGRQKWGARPAAWQALEDKTVVDALWDAVGVPRAPAEVVGTADLVAAVDRIGQPVVVAGDSREGFNGGASYTRWVGDADSLEAARDFFSAHCDRVRVMPFLEGIPCSIHGVVFPEYVAALRPCEMLVYRGADQQFRYLAASTSWDPPDEDRVEMRTLARAVGEHLRQTVDYRGAFTMDGVMTADGFRPTELNPRIGAAMFGLSSRVPEIPLMLLNLALVEGVEADWQPEAFERTLVEGADANRFLGGGLLVEEERTENRVAWFRWDDGHAVACDEDDSDGTVRIGPGPMGGYLRISIDADSVPTSVSGAPWVARAAAFAGRCFGVEIGVLEPIRDVRT